MFLGVIVGRRHRAEVRVDERAEGGDEADCVVGVPRGLSRVLGVDSDSALVCFLELEEEPRHEDGCDAAHKWEGECGEEGVGL